MEKRHGNRAGVSLLPEPGAPLEVFAGEGAIDAECRTSSLGSGHDGQLHVANDVPRDEHTGHARGLVVATQHAAIAAEFALE